MTNYYLLFATRYLIPTVYCQIATNYCLLRASY